VQEVFDAAGYQALEFFDMNDHSKWRGGGAADRVYTLLGQLSPEHALLLNTTVAVITRARQPISGQSAESSDF
jgi:hypothetical protein